MTIQVQQVTVCKLLAFLLLYLSFSSEQTNVDARLSVDSDGWLQLSPNLSFQRNADLSSSSSSMENPTITNHATDQAINRMLKKSKSSIKNNPNPSYMYQSIDSDAIYDDFQLAWRLLGFYVDCNTPNSYGSGCNRQVLYAVYVDPYYEGGGMGEYMYYDKDVNEFLCYGPGECRLKMDCHLSDTEWVLLGVFKIETIVGRDGLMGQLFKHEGFCAWGQETYDLESSFRETIPYYCKATTHKLKDGNYLYYAAKPEVNGNVTLGLYVDNMCSIEYTGSDFNVFELFPSHLSYWESFNEALDEYKQCQPCMTFDLSSTDELDCTNVTEYTNSSYQSCITYGLSTDDLNCTNVAMYANPDQRCVTFNVSTDEYNCTVIEGYTNANKCVQFARDASSKPASMNDIILAARQQGLVSFEVVGVTYGGVMNSENLEWDYDIATETTSSASAAPDFVASWAFFTASVLFCSLGLATFVKTSRWTPFLKSDKAVALLRERSPHELPAKRFANFANVSSVYKCLSARRTKKQEKNVKSFLSSSSYSTSETSFEGDESSSSEMCSDGLSSCSRSLNSVGWQACYSNQSNRSRPIVRQSLDTSSNSITAEKEKKDSKAVIIDKRVAVEEGKAASLQDTDVLSLHSRKSQRSSSQNKKFVELASITKKSQALEVSTEVKDVANVVSFVSRNSKRSSRSQSHKSLSLAPVNDKLLVNEVLTSVARSSSDSKLVHEDDKAIILDRAAAVETETAAALQENSDAHSFHSRKSQSSSRSRSNKSVNMASVNKKSVVPEASAAVKDMLHVSSLDSRNSRSSSRSQSNQSFRLAPVNETSIVSDVSMSKISSTSYRSASFHTSFDKQSNRSQSALEQILETLSNSIPKQAKEHNEVLIVEKEVELENSPAETVEDASEAVLSHSKIKSRTQISKPLNLAPINEGSPRAEVSTSASKSLSTFMSKKLMGSKKFIGLKFLNKVFGGKSDKGTNDVGDEHAVATSAIKIADTQPPRNLLSLADSDGISTFSNSAAQSRGGIIHNSCMAVGKNIHKNIEPLVFNKEDRNGFSHDMCMHVGERVHLCVSPKEVVEKVRSPKMVGTFEDKVGQEDKVLSRKKGVSDNSKGEKIEAQNNNVILHSSLKNSGQGIHSFAPLDGARYDDDKCMAVGRSVQNLGEGFYDLFHGQPKNIINANSKKEGIDSEIDHGVVHNSLMTFGQSIHNLVPLDGAQGNAPGHDACTAVGRGVQNFGEGFYDLLHNINKKEGIDGESEYDVVRNSLMSFGQGIQNLVPIDRSQGSALGHDACMSVGRGVQKFGEGFYDVLHRQPKKHINANSNKERIVGGSNDGVVHKSLMNFGQGIHRLVPLDGEQDSALEESKTTERGFII